MTEQRLKADQKLRESEDMFRSLAETIQSAILVYVGTKCRYANREAEVITGYTRGELLSMHSLNLIHADSRGRRRFAWDPAEARRSVCRSITK